MIAVALPAILRHFGADLGVGDWLITSYLVTMAAIQPIAGKLGDRFGRRPLLLGGLAYFGLASLGAAVAPTLPLLLLFRFQQAIAGALALPNGAALVREVIPAERRGGSFGLIGAATGVAAAAGPPLGGVLTFAAGWQAIFWVNVPFVLGALLLGWRSVPSARRAKAASTFDAQGAALLFAALAGLSLLLHERGAYGSSPLWLGGVTAVVALAVLFGRQELRHADPVLQPGFFRRRAFSAASAAVALSNLAMYTTLLALPVLLARDAGRTSASIGATLAGLSVMSVVCSPVGGWLADRAGRRMPVVLGLSLFAIALVPLGVSRGLPPTPALIAILAAAGAGLGLSMAGMQAAAVEAVGPRDAGAASGIFSTSRYVGSIVGASVLPDLVGSSSASDPTAVFALIVPAAFLAALASLALTGEKPV